MNRVALWLIAWVLLVPHTVMHIINHRTHSKHFDICFHFFQLVWEPVTSCDAPMVQLVADGIHDSVFHSPLCHPLRWDLVRKLFLHFCNYLRQLKYKFFRVYSGAFNSFPDYLYSWQIVDKEFSYDVRSKFWSPEFCFIGVLYFLLFFDVHTF